MIVNDPAYFCHIVCQSQRLGEGCGMASTSGPSVKRSEG
jgi:hypothetical protein